jgi:hypothetical protein
VADGQNVILFAAVTSVLFDCCAYLEGLTIAIISLFLTTMSLS